MGLEIHYALYVAGTYLPLLLARRMMPKEVLQTNKQKLCCRTNKVLS
jgi:hypothetical protein